MVHRLPRRHDNLLLLHDGPQHHHVRQLLKVVRLHGALVLVGHHNQHRPAGGLRRPPLLEGQVTRSRPG